MSLVSTHFINLNKNVLNRPDLFEWNRHDEEDDGDDDSDVGDDHAHLQVHGTPYKK